MGLDSIDKHPGLHCLDKGLQGSVVWGKLRFKIHGFWECEHARAGEGKVKGYGWKGGLRV